MECTVKEWSPFWAEWFYCRIWLSIILSFVTRWRGASAVSLNIKFVQHLSATSGNIWAEWSSSWAEWFYCRIWWSIILSFVTRWRGAFAISLNIKFVQHLSATSGNTFYYIIYKTRNYEQRTRFQHLSATSANTFYYIIYKNQELRTKN
jgi:hypothetical protein